MSFYWCDQIIPHVAAKSFPRVRCVDHFYTFRWPWALLIFMAPTSFSLAALLVSEKVFM